MGWFLVILSAKGLFLPSDSSKKPWNESLLPGLSLMLLPELIAMAREEENPPCPGLNQGPPPRTESYVWVGSTLCRLQEPWEGLGAGWVPKGSWGIVSKQGEGWMLSRQKQQFPTLTIELFYCVKPVGTHMEKPCQVLIIHFFRIRLEYSKICRHAYMWSKLSVMI